jgi:hypothetical protein
MQIDPHKLSQAPSYLNLVLQIDIYYMALSLKIQTYCRGRRDPGGRPEEEESPLAIKRRPADPRTVFSR